jgi:hypothetical protein
MAHESFMIVDHSSQAPTPRRHLATECPLSRGCSWVLLQPAGGGFPLQNFFYALQWLIFAGFVVFFWWRWIGLDLREYKQRKEAP